MEAQEEVTEVTAIANTDTPATTQTGRDARDSSHAWIDRLVDAAAGDDTVLLELIKEHLEVCKDHVAALRVLRSEAIVRERAAGKSNMDLKDAAGLSDSQVSRAAIAAGGQRRFKRRRGLPDRRVGERDRRSSGSP